MDEMKEELEYPRKIKNRLDVVAMTQQRGVEEARRLLVNIFQLGIASADVEYVEELCGDMEALSDYYIPGILRNFRHLFYILYYVEQPELRPMLIAHVNYLLVVVDQAEKHLQLRLENKDPDVTLPIETHLGYFWRNVDLLEYKMYEDNAEILQLSLNSTADVSRRSFTDKGYWFNLKSRKIHYTRRNRPTNASQYIKSNDTEFDVLQPEILFVYPGKINCRIRWKETERRVVTSEDLAVLLESAETDYTDAANRMKESFREPLTEPTPALLIKLHKAFMNGDHLVLEDEQGGLLTVMDLPRDSTPTSELLQAILPAQPVGCALLVEVNENLQSTLFSVKPLSIVTPDRIIRLLY